MPEVGVSEEGDQDIHCTKKSINSWIGVRIQNISQDTSIVFLC